MENEEGFISKHGGYCSLITYQKAEIIYDGTVYFCNVFLISDILKSLRLLRSLYKIYTGKMLAPAWNFILVNYLMLV